MADRPRPHLLTFGHGTADQEQIARLLAGAEVTALVDVRRFPGSRRHPHVARDALEQWLPQAGVDYRWEPRLGGRRRAARLDGATGPDTWWRVEAFAAYAEHMRSPEFAGAFDELLDGAARGRTVVLCSETVWWRCHRRLISDATTLLAGGRVEHLGHDGRLTEHPPAAGARVTDDGLVYDLPA